MTSEQLAILCKTIDEQVAIAVKAEQELFLNVAHGCVDYGGGYRSDEAKLAIFHHGVATVVSALEGTVANRRAMQIRTLEAIGAKVRELALTAGSRTD